MANRHSAKIIEIKTDLPKNQRFKWGVFDSETWPTEGMGRNIFALGVTRISTVRDYKVFRDPESMWSYLIDKRHAGYTWYAHFIQYDFPIVTGQNILSLLNDCIFSGTRLVRGTYQGEGYEVYFADSLNLLPVSLKKLIKDKDTPKKFLEQGHRHVITEDDIRYCKADVAAVIDAIHGLEVLFGRPCGYTLASSALIDWRTKYLPAPLVCTRRPDEPWRDTYFGGRVQVFKQGTYSNINIYDVNSMYPWVLFHYPLPVPFIRDPVDKDPGNFTKLLGSYNDMKVTGWASCWVDVPKGFTVLPKRIPGEGNQYPVGKFHGSWTWQELRLAVRTGTKILKVHEAWQHPVQFYGHQKFIAYWYQARLKAKKDKNHLFDLLIKLIMNASYGKYGEGRERKTPGRADDKPRPGWTFTSIDHDHAHERGAYGFWLPPEGQGRDPTEHTVMSWASSITSWARVRLAELILEAGIDNVYYCDTDSVHTTAKLVESEELGGLKLEHVVLAGHYVAKKHYKLTYEKDGKIVCEAKCKGVPIRDPWKWDPYAKNIKINRLALAKESMRRGLPAGSKIIAVREFDSRKWTSNLPMLDEDEYVVEED